MRVLDPVVLPATGERFVLDSDVLERNPLGAQTFCNEFSGTAMPFQEFRQEPQGRRLVPHLGDKRLQHLAS